MVTTGEGLMTVNPITDQLGFTMIHLRVVEIANETNTKLQMAKTGEIQTILEDLTKTYKCQRWK